MHPLRAALVLTFTTLLCLAGAPSRPLAVAAASDLQTALPEVVAAFERGHPDIRVGLTFGSSGMLATQILNGAPFDLFLSADQDYPRRITAAGLAQAGTAFVYGRGRLALWTRRGSGIPVAVLGWKALEHPGAHRLALANPRHAPYGRAAEDALRTTGLLERLRPRLVLGENVAQAAQFAQTGHADVAILALSLASSAALRGKGELWVVPSGFHGPLDQAGLVLSRAVHKDDAEAFRTFLLAPEGQALLQRHLSSDGQP